jgi:hypothetical protein
MEPNSKTTMSRRGLLKAVAGLGAGAAAIGIPAFVFMAEERESGSPAAMTSPSTAPGEPGTATTNHGPIVAYIRDASSGEVSVMRGTEESIVRDARLVAQIMGAMEA